MKILMTLAIVLAGLHFSLPVDAHKGREECSTSALAGKWIFATGIGHQALEDAPAPPGDITALGTMNLNRDGTLEGVFDVTFEGGEFIPGVPYSGSAMLNGDCTGTLSFVTAAGTARTDSIALVDADEIWAMSQDPGNLWTYKVRRISGSGSQRGKWW